MRVAETLEVELIGASAGGTLHRHEVGQRADRRLDAVDALDIRARAARRRTARAEAVRTRCRRGNVACAAATQNRPAASRCAAAFHPGWSLPNGGRAPRGARGSQDPWKPLRRRPSWLVLLHAG